MLCTRCNKRTAVVFITAVQGHEKRNEGLCLVCAKDLGIPQVKEYLEEMGISEDELEEFADHMIDLDELDGDSFQRGGTTGALPSFIQNLLGGLPSGAGGIDSGKIGSLDSLFENAFGKHDRYERTARVNGKERERNGVGNGKKVAAEPKKKRNKFLDNFCTNLTQRAKENKLDDIIGRDKEISRTIQILSRRQKNNPCLIGEPGVGKTAIAEGIALKIASGNVPFNLMKKNLYLLDLTALVAGTQFRGQFESRVKGLIEEIKSVGNVILFIDEVHSLVGAGDSEGSMNAANILKPALSRGEVQVIGATTFKEYRKYIEKDGALERRFQPVTVAEPTVSETEHVLTGIRKYYESHHRVKVTDPVLRMCAVLSERYINDRFLPDKAIDLLDEACACRSIRSKELAEYDALCAELEEHVAKKTELDEKVSEITESGNPNYELLAELKSSLALHESEIYRLETARTKMDDSVSGIYVEESDLAKVIELWTGIPASKAIESEYSKIAALDGNLKKHIIGQDEAVLLVSKAVKRARVRLNKRRRPASFIFVGPTGVGKTELVKVLANELFDGNEPLIRLDMTEFMEKHTVSRLIGSPPGYVGFDEAGQLTEKVRRKPYSVVLFDEIEKAHPDVMNILLQILDEGKVNDAQGRSVSFENTIVAMTSNAGSTDKSTGIGFNKSTSDISKEKAMKALSDFLRPEFLSRIDEVVVFNPLTRENYEAVAALMLDEMKEPLSEKNIAFEYDKAALSVIAEKSYGKKFGARDIRKFIRTDIEDEVAELIINSTARPFAELKIGAKGEEIDIIAV
ncbi:MAG: ATP-dependent Clp protease ATP-binding subunit [Oscillospiraceae bacterium]|nr:ATP-dependent Clp protease ATP-binding subunit [Oscillospiraceae bacterium]